MASRRAEQYFDVANTALDAIEVDVQKMAQMGTCIQDMHQPPKVIPLMAA